MAKRRNVWKYTSREIKNMGLGRGGRKGRWREQERARERERFTF